MNEAEIDKHRKRLLQSKSELEGLAETSKESTKPVELDQASVGRLSRMGAMQGQQMAQELARRREQQLIKIDGSLRRIANGEYGDCFVCGREIDVRRLFTDPTITRCVGCMEV